MPRVAANATGIKGIAPDGWNAIKQMEKAR